MFLFWFPQQNIMFISTIMDNITEISLVARIRITSFTEHDGKREGCICMAMLGLFHGRV